MSPCLLLSTPEFLSDRAWVEPVEWQLLLLGPLLGQRVARGPACLPEVQEDRTAVPDFSAREGMAFPYQHPSGGTGPLMMTFDGMQPMELGCSFQKTAPSLDPPLSL